ncbi:MAG: carbohydrate-binding family 9-like protein [Bryobacterales bacterium]|nr:carbohydrate-binding family 9-like protein [Bryobacterales bacterium]
MLFTLLFIAFAAPAACQSYEVHRTGGKIVVDGRLDDDAWKRAAFAELQFPWEQPGAKQKTAVRLLWDEDYLYAAFECDDADVTAHFDQRDDPTYRDDAVELFLNPNPKQSFYYGMEMNARGTLYDYFYAWPHLLLKRIDFSGVLLATRIRGTLNLTSDTDQGWSLEVAIPWRNFEELTKALPPARGSEWTANLNRWDGVEPKRRLSVWADTKLERPSPHQPARFGKLVFVE